jgi:hypothetical protein
LVPSPKLSRDTTIVACVKDSTESRPLNSSFTNVKSPGDQGCKLIVVERNVNKTFNCSFEPLKVHPKQFFSPCFGDYLSTTSSSSVTIPYGPNVSGAEISFKLQTFPTFNESKALSIDFSRHQVRLNSSTTVKERVPVEAPFVAILMYEPATTSVKAGDVIAKVSPSADPLCNTVKVPIVSEPLRDRVTSAFAPLMLPLRTPIA